MNHSSSISEALEDARRLRAGGRVDEAAARLEPMLAAFPGHLETLLELAQIALAQRRMDACLSLLDTATGHHPEDAELHFRRATVLQQLGRLDDNIAYIQAYSGHGVAPTHIMARITAEMIAEPLNPLLMKPHVCRSMYSTCFSFSFWHT